MTTGNAPTIEFKEFSRKQIAELADWCEGFDMTGVSVSDADKLNGSPKTGDKIARNPKNHADRWLVAADYFADNFEPVEKLAALEKPVPVEPECVKYLAQYEQADEDGIIVKVSRQAIHETLAHIDSLQSALQRAQEDARDSALESLGYLRDKEKAEERNRRMVELMKEPSAPMKNMARGLLNLSTVKTEADATMLFKAMSAELLKEMEK